MDCFSPRLTHGSRFSQSGEVKWGLLVINISLIMGGGYLSRRLYWALRDDGRCPLYFC